MTQAPSLSFSISFRYVVSCPPVRYKVYMQISMCFYLAMIAQKEFGMNELQGGLMGSLVYIGLVISSAFSGVYCKAA